MLVVECRTNVADLRIGSDSAGNLGNKLGTLMVTTTDTPLQVTRAKLGGIPAAVVMIESMEESWPVSMLADLSESTAVKGRAWASAQYRAETFDFLLGTAIITDLSPVRAPRDGMTCTVQTCAASADKNPSYDHPER